MTAVGAGPTERDFEQLISQINEAIERVQQLTVELGDRLTQALRWLPPGIGDAAIMRSWDRFLGLKDQIFDEIQEFVSEPGVPPALTRIGEYWNTDVGAPVSELHQVVSAYGMKADDHWSGSAASAYEDSADAQSAAIETIKPMAEKIQSMLVDLAWGVVAFWAALVTAFLTFIAGLISAVGLAFGVVTAPAAPVDAAATAAAVLGMLGAAVMALIEYSERINKSMTTARQLLTDNTGMVKVGDTWRWPPIDNTGTWSVRAD
ncbi:hypothetical protein ACQEVC_14345 [Plantactinospora sp. CA-294935]|uniref:hypothetical protein n=1 Tax=Plantactinospora sp. CA-294935 TaxID=3240012 RepID=UPI003D8FE858